MALMIHGGGHMTLSRKSVRPHQTAFLLAHGILPVSIDYRLCPEVDLVAGPIADTLDAYKWVKTALPLLARRRGVLVDSERVVVVGWSSGGHLAMTTAWMTGDVAPPRAVLAFYAPTDFESGDLDRRRAEEYPERSMEMRGIVKALPKTPVREKDYLLLRCCAEDNLLTNRVSCCRSPATMATVLRTPPASAGCAPATRAPNSSCRCSRRATGCRCC
ncbi:hypothetical protein SLS55_009726 [Diplodia seriata]|uniref:Alpha/beta hydrolase fold-3 domain-containing protein n=1 Tax=Diplodia seriata TaxID=420778 RepID=A0ABR3C4B1_9PEZI